MMQLANGFGAFASLAAALLLPLIAAPARAGTLERVRAAGKLTIGYVADAQPFSYKDESGKPAGYSIALCGKVADTVKAELGLSELAVEYVAVASEDRMNAVKQGRADLLCSEVTITLARRRDVAFSIPIFASGISAILRGDSSARLQDVLSGREAPYRPRWRASMAEVLEHRTFSAVAGTTAEAWLRERKVALNVLSRVVAVESYDAGIKSVVEGESDAFFGDRPILLVAAKRSPTADELVVLDRRFTFEPLALALERGDEDFRLLVDRCLSGLYRSGEIGSLYATYFGEPDEETLTLFRMSAQPE